MSKRDSDFVQREVRAGGVKGVLSGLIFACPAMNREDAPTTYPPPCRSLKCPLRGIRCLHDEDRVRWLRRVTEERAAEIVKQHSDCIGEFEQ